MMTLSSRALAFANDFIDREQLPAEYIETINDFYAPLAQRIRSIVRQSEKVPLIGINGAQGTGKSTCVGCLSGLLEQQGLRVLVLSIDDLYYPKSVRQVLSEEVHPLFLTRGVPGTHEIGLLSALMATARGEAGEPVQWIPRFDKAVDDRRAHGTPFPEEGVDVVLFEGWCIGAAPQSSAALADPCNALEHEADPDGRWRSYINEKLSGEYAAAFELIDYLVMLHAPDFEKVYTWRGEQEARLRQRVLEQGLSAAEVMDEAELQYFISHYERLTRWMLEEMPQRADEVLLIGDDHEVHTRIVNSKSRIRYMVSTDLDATLLDEEYRWDAARPALEALTLQQAPLVLNSSKTVSEMKDLAAELTAACGMEPAPLVAENGGILAIPDTDGQYRMEHIGLSREQILSVAHRLRNEEGFVYTGFSDMQPEDVVEHTGLSYAAALQAMDRQATEPILWNDSADRWASFEKALNLEGIQAVRGGRFIHLMGTTDKANGLAAALEYFSKQDPASRWHVIALGDSPNDLGMLSAADIAVVINNPSHAEDLEPSAMQCLHPDHEGPVAWNTAILSILKNND